LRSVRLDEVRRMMGEIGLQATISNLFRKRRRISETKILTD